MKRGSKMRYPARSGPRFHRGTAILEFAFLLVFLLLLSLGITEFGRAFWYYSALQKGARDGARCVSQIDLTSNAAVANCRQLAADTANAAGVWPQLTSADNVFLVTSPVASPGDPPEYVQIAIRDYGIAWIWSLGEPLPVPGGKTALQVAATMPYMYVKP